MSEFEALPEEGDPWWAMVMTPHGLVPVRVASFLVTEEGVTAGLAELKGVDTSPEKVTTLCRMSRDEAWAQVAEWSQKRDHAVIRERGTAS
ncbi:hypothetical protein ABT147_18590 [Streptomyces sp. NPDC001868]|uniref:hypothetical protein n=1 Tax=Streptomyces sp. NPDC001868 TaxID=3154401 RepID=UPI00332E2830